MTFLLRRYCCTCVQPLLAGARGRTRWVLIPPTPTKNARSCGRSEVGGGGGIRTHGFLRNDGFQDLVNEAIMGEIARKLCSLQLLCGIPCYSFAISTKWLGRPPWRSGLSWPDWHVCRSSHSEGLSALGKALCRLLPSAYSAPRRCSQQHGVHQLEGQWLNKGEEPSLPARFLPHPRPRDTSRPPPMRTAGS